MFQTLYNSNGKKTCLKVTIKSDRPVTFCVVAEGYKEVNSKYADRICKVNGERVIYLQFPISPNVLFIRIFNQQDVNDKSFNVHVEESEFKAYNVWLSLETLRFIELSSYFSKVCGYENGTEQGRLFQTDDEEFTIRYYNVIKEKGVPINTPARIGHRTGVIDAAKDKMDKYTIPMRQIILLHEYSHKYKNPLLGLEISNEVGADINALYIYLGLGYSKIDAICVFAKVFLKAQSPGNMERMRKIMEYINKFENEQVAKVV